MRIILLTIFIVFVGSDIAFAAQPSQDSSAFDTRRIGEQEKLYRYFGAAADLREDGKFEETVEILEYILDKNPHDSYVEKYLNETRAEMRQQKKSWKKDSAQEARRLKKKKIKDLTEDGIHYYKAGDYDRALVSFSDVLSIDSDNSRVMLYMEKLKRHYARETKIENLAGSKKKISLKGPIDKVDLKYIALDKKANYLLNRAELAFKVDEIINAGKAEKERSRELALGPGDVLQISVLDHPELSGEVDIRVNGEIILPLVNDFVMAKDLTLGELTKEVQKTVKRYIQDPKVNISVIEHKNKMYYVIDEVSCTPYPITRPDFTLRDALFTADWGDSRALGRIVLTKPSARKPIVKKVNGFDLVYRGKLRDNVRIEDGDVIYIPLTFAAKVTKTVRDLLGPFVAVRQARDNYLNLKWNEHEWQDILRLPVNYDRQAEDSKDVNLENISLYDYIVTR